ncbi:SDR family NAD(P)-dependent oxidoreductase [Roseovarius pelagicus]|uniref:SDR family oxidoreductase n=1 Tax=Roseovarius pelagicus TaxID=2980108 RepID=A0ABY6DF39_9RHOB|nr:SDR family oxidoreductase [Roseovarius pelagicus]UXX82400.1 SDR family oxidoreductase [Roseovarius pelagicus]
MTQGYDGMNVLVTGANRGIGAACAKIFAQAGAHVLCADLNDPVETVETIRAAGGSAESAICDVSDEISVSGLFTRISEGFTTLDTVVNCAGIIHERGLLDTTTAEFDQVMAVNLRGSFLIGRESIRAMHPKSGRLIMIASDLSYYGREEFAPYVASKHGVLGLVRCWAKEFAPNILVNALCPGPIDTAMLAAENMTPEWRAKELEIPLARFGQPEEIAQMALFLAGPNAAYITGQGIGVNGGSIMP